MARPAKLADKLVVVSTAVHPTVKEQLRELGAAHGGLNISDVIRIHPKVIINARVIENPFLTNPDIILSQPLPQISARDLVTAP